MNFYELLNLCTVFLREGSQRKSSVEQSGTEIVANYLTRSFYEGACPNKKIKIESEINSD